jgi:hypothetical protein
VRTYKPYKTVTLRNFVVSKASEKMLLTTHSDRINTYMYGVYIPRPKFTYGHTNTDTEKIYLYICVHTTYILLRFWNPTHAPYDGEACSYLWLAKTINTYVYTVFLAGDLTCAPSYTVCAYGSGQPCTCPIASLNQKHCLNNITHRRSHHHVPSQNITARPHCTDAPLHC